MFVSRLYQELVHSRFNWARSRTWLLTSSRKNLYVLSKTPSLDLKPFRQISTSSVVISGEKKQEHSFTVVYLIDSCGLSREAAYAAAEKVQFESSEKPDSVLRLLKGHGFTETHIGILVRKRPRLLIANAYKTLKPKLEFLASVGISPSDLAGLLCSNPIILEFSLKRRLVPAFESLCRILGTNKDVITVLKRSSWVVSRNVKQFMLPNIMVLCRHGVPETRIASLIKNQPRTITHIAERFNLIVNEVKKMGFDPNGYAFVYAVKVLLGMRKSTWKRKVEIYKRWGWSEDDIVSAFRKSPHFMVVSEEKAHQKMDFLVNKIGTSPLDMVKHPTILMYSLKRIISRCLVVQLLLSKSLIEKNPSLCTVVLLTEKSFTNQFVTKYCTEVPQLLDLYQLDTDHRTLAFQSERLDNATNV